jgi:hypothetical protein
MWWRGWGRWRNVGDHAGYIGAARGFRCADTDAGAIADTYADAGTIADSDSDSDSDSDADAFPDAALRSAPCHKKREARHRL